MKCANCNGIGWLKPNFTPCMCCQGRGRVLPAFFEAGDTLKSVALDALTLIAVLAIAGLALFGLFFF